MNKGQLHHYYGPLRHPKQPSLTVTGIWLVVTRHHRLGLPVFRQSPLSTHADAITPAEPLGCYRSLVRWQRPSPNVGWVGFRNAPFRGLLSVHSRFGLRVRSITQGDLYTEYFNEFVTSFAALVASG